LIATVVGVVLSSPALAVDDVEPIDEVDWKVHMLLDDLVGAMELKSETARFMAVSEMVHPVLLKEDRSDVSAEFKKVLNRFAPIIVQSENPVPIDRAVKLFAPEGKNYRFGTLEVDEVERYVCIMGKSTVSVIVVRDDAGDPKIVAIR
jgi:hypothetical protein